MTFLEAVERSPFFLSDGGIETRIAFETDIPLDPEMGVARLVEDERGKVALEGIYRQYLDVGRRHDIPMQVGTPTFRAGPERLRRAGLTGPDDLDRSPRRVRPPARPAPGGARRLREEGVHRRGRRAAGGRLPARGGTGRGRGPRLPPGAGRGARQGGRRPPLRPDVPRRFGGPRSGDGHGRGGPALRRQPDHRRPGEAAGRHAAGRGHRPDRRAVTPRPAYYTVSCVHPSVLHEALRTDERLRRLAGDRLLGIKANASTKSPEERVALGHLDAEAPERLADEIVALREEFGLKVLGGCCGTDHRHIEALARRLAAERA